MNDPVDLTHLRELTGGDLGIEKKLFDIFISSGKECIKKLESNCVDGQNIEWRRETHALKGSAINIGAEKLANICEEAQDGSGAPLDKKSKILQKLKAEFDNTASFLKSI